MDQSDQNCLGTVRTLPLNGEVEGQSHDKKSRIVMRQVSYYDEGYEPEELDEDTKTVNERNICDEFSCNSTLILGENHSESRINGSLHDDDQSIEYNSIKEKNHTDRIIPNAWDSSPSTVDYNNDQDYESLHTFNEAVHIGESSRRNQEIDEDENDSDMELTQRSRQIQLDLRLREMTELALEAERAAAAGEEMFRGNATKFELGRGLDVDLPPLPPLTSTTPKANDVNSKRGLEPKDRIWNSRCIPFPCNNNNIGSSPPIEPWACQGKRVNAPVDFKSSPFRNRPVPSKLYQSPRTASVSSMTSHFPNLIKSNKPVAPTVHKIDKIHILNLRHIDDVIPNFKDMQPFMKMHLTRAGVEKIDESMTQSDKTANSLKSHQSTQVRISGFQQILRSFSSNSYTQKHISTNDDDNHSEEDEQIHCISTGSNDEYENSDPSNPDNLQLSDTNSSEHLYVDFLAAETYNIKHKRNPSPLPLAPYNEDINDGPTVVYVQTPSLPWLNFLSNMTPVRRSSMGDSPRPTLNFTENSSLKSIASTPKLQIHSKMMHSTTANKICPQEPSLLQFDNIEAQNDEDNDEVTISTNSFSSRIRRKSLSDFHLFEVTDIDKNVDDRETPNQKDTVAGTFPIKEAFDKSCEISVTKRNVSHHSGLPDNVDEACFDNGNIERKNALTEKSQHITSKGPMSDHHSTNCDQLSPTKDIQTENSAQISCVSNSNEEFESSSDEMHEKPVEKEELPSSAHRSTPLTKSLSIINLMVEKVPSVIERLNPLRKSKQSKYKDDVSFVENFMFVGVKQKYPSVDIEQEKPDQKKNFIYRSQTSCFDISCKSMFESLNCLHGDELEAVTIDPSASFVEPTSKFGHIQTADRRKKLLIGNRMFQPPSLKLHQPRNMLEDISEDVDTVQDDISLVSM